MGAADLMAARSYPNPELHLDVEDWLGSGAARGTRLLQLTVQVSQEIELGGQRAARIRAAGAAALTRDWRVAVMRLDLLARATMAFLDLLYAQELLERRIALEENAKLVLKNLSRMESAGRVLEPVVAQARIRLHLARAERKRVEATLIDRRLALAGLWGSNQARFGKASGKLGQLPKAPPLKDVLAAAGAHPAIRERDSLLAEQRARLESERRAAWPALGLRAGYRYLHGEEASALVLGVSLPLPLFSRNQGAIEVARVRLERARLERDKALVERNNRLARAHERLRSLAEEARTLNVEVLPIARQSFALLEEGFRLGRVQSLELLDAARTLLEVEERTLDASHRAHRALVSLKALVGTLSAPSSHGEAPTRGREVAR